MAEVVEKTAAVSKEEGLQSSGETCKLPQNLPSSVQVCNILTKLNCWNVRSLKGDC